ncbi:hypothetical protein ARALYDRAFT_909131 [Arabidopsis lyrata subsp. lyrata]|uniref:Defensin-like domain-containing protein n=1 Tax=Arabidopsis lyrata subsp. lyrata TaxID=81972 RepID=D7M4B0_ARALL|nr:hypothetical protein ARALYDRAFT_909131 [Arabidopsis lyrata subsp. lyrata]
MGITKNPITFFLVIILTISLSNYNVLAATGPPKCFGKCAIGYYEDHECISDCIERGYHYGGCVPNERSGKCCCTRA